jgi:hypothetical protein
VLERGGVLGVPAGEGEKLAGSQVEALAAGAMRRRASHRLLRNSSLTFICVHILCATWKLCQPGF